MLIGYARVSTGEQNLELQTDALRASGCKDEYIYTDKISGTKAERPGLQKAIEMCREGDVLTVWRLDRLGRSLQHLVSIVDDLQKRGIGFKSLTENFDTTSSGGKLIFHIFGALAEFERNIIVERTNAGLRAARARGRLGGRPKQLDNRQAEMAKALHADPKNSIDDICRTLGISKTTLYRYLKQ